MQKRLEYLGLLSTFRVPDTRIQLNMIKIDRGALTFDWLRYFEGQKYSFACEVQPLGIYRVFFVLQLSLKAASVLIQFIYGKVLNKQCLFA